MTASPAGVREGSVVEVLRGRDALAALAPEWDDLLGRAESPSPYCERGWVMHWVAEGRLSGTPVAVVVRVRGRLAALLVLDLRRRLGTLWAEPVGAEVPGHHGVLVDVSDPAAADDLAAHLAAVRVFDLLRIGDVATSDAATLRLLDALAARGLRVARSPRDPCLSIRLGRPWEEFLKETKSGKSRSTLRRKERKLLEAGRVEHLHLAGAEVTEAAVARAAAVHADSWLHARGASYLTQPFFRGLALAAAAAGRAHLHLVVVDGEDAAFNFVVEAGGEMHYVWPGFREKFVPLSVGQVLMAWTIRDACRDGVRTFDFGAGEADYKRFWSTDEHRIDRCAAGRGLVGGGIAGAHSLVWRAAAVPALRNAVRRVRSLFGGRAAPAPEPAREVAEAAQGAAIAEAAQEPGPGKSP